MNIDGPIYRTLLDDEKKSGNPYGDDVRRVIEETVANLEKHPTSDDRPGMLLGMIQSGKTRTFLGAIALAADNGYSLFIVLTKGTNALTKQTYERLKRAFHSVIDDDDLRVFDIMGLPKLSLREQKLPMILVAKKEKNNLERLKMALQSTYPGLRDRRTIIIDDEADFASVGFRRAKGEDTELQTVMRLIAETRTILPESSFLQVTATPYSLYLQPSTSPAPDGPEFKPIRPAFTVLVPVHNAYIGGKVYFEDSLKPDSVESALFVPVDPQELEILHHSDRRRFRLEGTLDSKAIATLRQAIVSFVVGGLIRRAQTKRNGEKPKKYSFIIHTERARGAHTWQEEVIDALVDSLLKAAEQNTERFRELVRCSYDDMARSIGYANAWLPSLEQVLLETLDNLYAVQVEKVNTDNDVKALLDSNGQLELRNRLNIFIGGQIIDRGLTISNLIGFYYGRRANRFQQDTVLQHSRMYGARAFDDLTVTRFYTSPDIHNVLRTIHEFDAGLRNAFKAGGNNAGVAFIRQEGRQIVPCSPNKILLSTLTTLTAGKRLLPIGFQTGYRTNVAKHLRDLDAFVAERTDPSTPDKPVLIALPDAKRIVDMAEAIFDGSEGYTNGWNPRAFKASMEYVSKMNPSPEERGQVYLLIRRDRDNSRIRESGRFFDAPDTSHIEGEIARRIGRRAPVLMAFRQNGKSELGWRDCPFWWPVLYMPQQMGTVVFASDVDDGAEESGEGNMP